jgi:integrase
MKRRANNEGTIFERADGRWIGRYQIRLFDGSMKDININRKSQKEVKEQLDQIKNDIATGRYVDPSRVILGDWIDQWLNVMMKNSIRETTYQSYKNTIEKHIKPKLGKIEIQKLTAANIKRLMNEKTDGERADGKEGGLSVRSVRYIYRMINGALKQAKVEGLISFNPCEAIKQPKLNRKEQMTIPLNKIGQFLKTAKYNGHYNRYFLVYYLVLNTGLRRGEVLGLRWKDIDLVEKRLKVVQQVVIEANKPVLRKLKTDTSQDRIIYLSDAVIDEIKEYKASLMADPDNLIDPATGRQRERPDGTFDRKPMEGFLRGALAWDDLKIARYFTNGLVFIDLSGNVVNPSSMVRSFKGLLKITGLPQDIRFHDLRHTFAELSLEHGIDIKTLQNDLGHASIETTLDIYGHVNERMKKDAAEKRGEIFQSILK